MKIYMVAIVLAAFVSKGCINSHSESETESMPIIAGTYTDEAGSKGLYVFDYNPVTYSFGMPRLVAEANNPSFGVYDREHQYFYAVGESDPGTVSSYARLKNNTGLAIINTRQSEGAHPCYISLSPGNDRLAVANYSSGNVSVFQIDSVSGALQTSPQILQHRGHGPDAGRQTGPHAHWVRWSPDGRYLYAVDLGIDQVMVYPVDPKTGAIGNGKTALSMPAGAGPRHMVFHPNIPLSYVLNELSNTVVVSAIDEDGSLSPIQTISILPESYDGHNQGAHIEISLDGKYLYTTNRGHDSIAVFKVITDGTLEHIQEISTKGKWPRFFMLTDDGMSLLVANQESNNIAAFAIQKDGSLLYTGNQIEISKPVYLSTIQ